MRPLTDQEVRARLAAPDAAGRVDLAGVVLRGTDLRGLELRHVDFGHRDGPCSELIDVRFEGAVLHDCVFVGATLQGCRFQGARLDACDLRYVEMVRTSFKGAQLHHVDLYRGRLGPGTVFEDADISRCSLHLASLEGVTLPRAALAEGVDGRLLPERAADFARYHARLEELGRGDGRTALHVARRHGEAARVYRALVGHWTSVGATRDASWAYVRAKRLETRALRPDVVHRRRAAERRAGQAPAGPTLPRAVLGWLGGLLADASSGYGERPLRVLGTAVVWTLAMGMVFWARGLADGAIEGYVLSLQALSTTLPELTLGTVDRALVATVTIVGITLLGLLGFTLGNRLRNA